MGELEIKGDSVYAGVVTLGRNQPGLNYIRLSPFSIGPLTEAGLFLRLEVEHLTAFTLTLDSLATHVATANEHRYELPGIAVAPREKSLLI